MTVPSPRQPFAVNEKRVPRDALDFVRRRLGPEFVRGYGYSSWVFLGAQSVIKVDPIEGRRGEYEFDRFADGLEVGRAVTPSVIDGGVAEGHEWIETSRILGRPAYEVWLGRGEDEQLRFMEQLRVALGEWRVLLPPDGSLRSPDEGLLTIDAVQRELEAASGLMPAEYSERSAALIAEYKVIAGPAEEVLVHHDVWFGNLIVDDDLNLNGLVDFGHAVRASKDVELDTTLRFWRYPWLFAPEEWEERFREPLDASLLNGIVADCVGEIDRDEVAVRLAFYDLGYRLKKIADWGWADDQRMFMDGIFWGEWVQEVLK